MAETISADDDDIFSKDEGKESVQAAIAVLKAKVDLLTYFVKHVLVWKHEFVAVKLIAYGVVTTIVAMLGAMVVYFLKQ